MHVSFLCPEHRDWVYFNQNEALSWVESAHYQGEVCIEHNQWQQAMNQLGCAFEATEILLDLQGPSTTFLVTRLTSLSLSLTQCFKQVSLPNFGLALLDQVAQRLHIAIDISGGCPEKTAFLNHCLEKINNHYQLGLHSSSTASALTH